MGANFVCSHCDYKENLEVHVGTFMNCFVTHEDNLIIKQLKPCVMCGVCGCGPIGPGLNCLLALRRQNKHQIDPTATENTTRLI